MVEVVAVGEIPEMQEPEIQETEMQEPEIQNTPSAPELSASGTHAERAPEIEEPKPKRKAGRPKKEVQAPQEPKTVSEAHAKQSFAPRVKPPPKPKAKPRVPKENIPNQLPEAPASLPFQGLSSAELVAELVNRRRVEERAMKANLYRSFVM